MLRLDLGDGQWRCWMRPLKVKDLTNETLTLIAPSTLIINRIKSQYMDRLMATAQANFPNLKEIIFEKG